MGSPNKDLLLRYLAAYNRDAMAELAELVVPTYEHHSSGVSLTLDEFKAGAAWLRKGLPDLQIDLEDMVEEGDRVAVRFVVRGTHLVSMLGEAVTSKQIAFNGCTIFRLEDGRIAEDWEALDEAHLMWQIGAVPD